MLSSFLNFARRGIEDKCSLNTILRNLKQGVWASQEKTTLKMQKNITLQPFNI